MDTAVGSALSGDMLLLQTGDYVLNGDITLPAGITIRSEDAGQKPRVVFDSHKIWFADGFVITIQSLEFVGYGILHHQSNTKANIYILENTFTDVRFSLINLDSCYIVGNTLIDIKRLDLYDSCYVAGNTISLSRYTATRTKYFIGNKVDLNSIDSTGQISIHSPYTIGNEFIHSINGSTPSKNKQYNVIQSTAQWAFIANNTIKVIGTSDTAPGFAIDSLSAIELGDNARLHNECNPSSAP